ncbi:MAG: tRNA (adenosine(37)-N6)-threonylcarbamoyltransferase complex dimerization subunit type 1 TsaB [Candidatus Binatia bacterium]
MRILGIDTATSIASVALIEDGELAAEEIQPQTGTAVAASSAAPRANHAETILPLIDAVLGRHGLSASQLSGLAASIGPGSFTGLRIGLSTIKGLGYSSGIPVVGVSTLLANASRTTEWEGLICSFLDARKNEVYAALFRKSGSKLSRFTQDIVAPARSVVRLVQSIGDRAPCLFVGEGAEVYRQLLSETLGTQAHLLSAAALPSVAAAVARVSEERFRRNDVDPLATLIPLYLRPPEAELRSRDTLQLCDITVQSNVDKNPAVR